MKLEQCQSVRNPEARLDPTGEEHPALHDLQRLMRGELPRAEAKVVVRHLLKGCPGCIRETRRLWSFGEQPLRPLPEPPALPSRETGLWS